MKSHDINWLRFLPYHPPGWFRPNVRVAEPGLKTWKPCAKSHARRSHQSGFRSKSTPYQRLLYIYIYIVPKWILDPSLSKLLISVFLDIWWSMMIYGYIYIWHVYDLSTPAAAQKSRQQCALYRFVFWLMGSLENPFASTQFLCGDTAGTSSTECGVWSWQLCKDTCGFIRILTRHGDSKITS